MTRELTSLASDSDED
jgi:hypothetical protein